ncbi:hypothetical protein [Rhodococcus erythropolis]|uniref:hypothetical protein n=1 Tax=Rhodococcus erythropolis TaxID=1833 RepID=UPI003818DB0A
MRTAPFADDEAPAVFAPIMLHKHEAPRVADRSRKTIQRWKRNRHIRPRGDRIPLVDLEDAKADAQARQRATQFDGSRRVPGPGRPRSAKRLQVDALLEQGLTNAEIIDQVGICSPNLIATARRAWKERQ